LHRARSVILTSAELVEIRAAQRTFEGAYIRTAIGQFSFALIVLKIFTAEFYSIGALFAVYGAGILFISLFRRQHGMSLTRNDEVVSRQLRAANADSSDRKQTILLRSGRRWIAPQEVQN
jgi:hypothetical protein